MNMMNTEGAEGKGGHRKTKGYLLRDLSLPLRPLCSYPSPLHD